LACFSERGITDQYIFDLFAFQYERNLLYQTFCNNLSSTPDTISALEDIPFLPISFFTTHTVSVKEKHETIYRSSGTTGQVKSQHFVTSVADYLNTATHIFEDSYGPIQEKTFLCLLPSYLERQDASLVAMCRHFVSKSDDERSGFYLNNTTELEQMLNILKQENKPTVVIGVTFALLDFAEQHPIQGFPSLIVMETGGMKGRKKEMVREEVHEKLMNGFGVRSVHSEYGMTELLSQAYSHGNGVFTPSKTLRILRRDISDPLTVTTSEGTGALNVIDLANTMSCPFIATQDIVRISPNEQFEILGRTDASDIRGCNLMVV